MKSKKLFFSTFLLLSGIATYIIFTSSANAAQGVMGASTTGCGTCHGSASGATAITVTGIPANGFISGTTYNMTLTITNASKLAAGFDLSVTAGSLSNAPANTMLMGTSELHHTAPLQMTGGNAVWNFSWTAPATGNSVTINVAGNAVNNNGSDSGDQWNKISVNYTKAIPSDISDVEKTSTTAYPNPVTDYLHILSADMIEMNSFTATTMNGSSIRLMASTKSNTEYILDTKSLADGYYILTYYSANGLRHHTNFIKK